MLTKEQIDALIDIISTFTAITGEVPSISSGSVIVFIKSHPRHPFFLWGEDELSRITHECPQCRTLIYTRGETLRSSDVISFPAKQFLMVMLGLLATSRTTIEGYPRDASSTSYDAVIDFLQKNKNHIAAACALVGSIKRMETRTEPSFPPLATYLDNIVWNTDNPTFSIPPFEAFLEDLERKAAAAAIAAPRSLVGDGYRRIEDVVLALAFEESRVTYSREAADRSSLEEVDVAAATAASLRTHATEEDRRRKEEAELAAAVEQSMSTFEEDRALRAAAEEAPPPPVVSYGHRLSTAWLPLAVGSYRPGYGSYGLPVAWAPPTRPGYGSYGSAADAAAALPTLPTTPALLRGSAAAEWAPPPPPPGPSAAAAAAAEATTKAAVIEHLLLSKDVRSTDELTIIINQLDAETLLSILNSKSSSVDCSIIVHFTLPGSGEIIEAKYDAILKRLHALGTTNEEITALFNRRHHLGHLIGTVTLKRSADMMQDITCRYFPFVYPDYRPGEPMQTHTLAGSHPPRP